MADAADKVPAKTDEKQSHQDRSWSPFVALRTEIDRLFDDLYYSWGV
jgi:hypothetical protein